MILINPQTLPRLFSFSRISRSPRAPAAAKRGYVRRGAAPPRPARPRTCRRTARGTRPAPGTAHHGRTRRSQRAAAAQSRAPCLLLDLVLLRSLALRSSGESERVCASLPPRPPSLARRSLSLCVPRLSIVCVVSRRRHRPRDTRPGPGAMSAHAGRRAPRHAPQAISPRQSLQQTSSTRNQESVKISQNRTLAVVRYLYYKRLIRGILCG